MTMDRFNDDIYERDTHFFFEKVRRTNKQIFVMQIFILFLLLANNAKNICEWITSEKSTKECVVLLEKTEATSTPE